jgi:hypothetical protein
VLLLLGEVLNDFLINIHFAGPTESNINIVINTAEVRHQAQVAPITKGSRKVR